MVDTLTADATTWAVSQFDSLSGIIKDITLTPWFIPFIVALLSVQLRSYFKGFVVVGIVMWLGLMTLEQATATVVLIIIGMLAREGYATMVGGQIPTAPTPTIDPRAKERAKLIYDRLLRRGGSGGGMA